MGNSATGVECRFAADCTAADVPDSEESMVCHASRSSLGLSAVSSPPRAPHAAQRACSALCARRCSVNVARSFAWRTSALAAAVRASRLKVTSGTGDSEHAVREVSVIARTRHELEGRCTCSKSSSHSSSRSLSAFAATDSSASLNARSIAALGHARSRAARRTRSGVSVRPSDAASSATPFGTPRSATLSASALALRRASSCKCPFITTTRPLLLATRPAIQ